MSRNLKHLNALRAFEAAARHESLTRAAQELNVTHAAISRHVRELERSLGVTLFERTGRGVSLTETGRMLARDLTEGLDLIARAMNRFARGTRRRARLSITSDVPFAAYWLVPRLGRFTLAHPEIELILDPTSRIVDFAREDADIGIRFGNALWKGIEYEKLFDAELTLVASPRYLKVNAINSILDLRGVQMIQEQDRSYWQSWLEAAGISAGVAPSGPTLLADLTVSAAEAGQGVALSDRVIAFEALRAGRLVAPFDVSIKAGGYYLVYRSRSGLTKQARAFRSWLIGEMAQVLGRHGPFSHGAGEGVTGTKRARKPPTT